MLDSLPLEDPAEIERSHRRAQHSSLRWVLVCVTLTMLVMAVADQLLSPPGESRAYISLSMGILALLSYLLVRLDRRKWESPLMVTGVMVATTWAVYSYGSVRSASTFAYLGAVVMAGTYLRLRALWITTIAGVLLLGLLTWAEASGNMAQAGLVPDLRYWLMGSVIILLIGAQLHHTRKANDEVYLRHLSQVEERLRLEHERDQSMRRFRRIFLLNPTALLVQTANTQAVVEANPAFERSFGYRGDQIAGLHAGALWVDGQEWQEHRKTLIERGHTDWQQRRWRRADGTEVEVLVSSELSEDRSGMLILTTVIDAPGAG
ncbi:PAS domain S-box protein [Hydrogenophaga sp. MI9]|uniref:PAS domain S-box protein n=1 Tax=Hydrogenophaga sp. MI9 TaxID=3453719 RepID=UPI003EEBBCB6